MNYDFSQLNDKEFEVIACDLLSKHLNECVERFKGGRDGGVDGRFFSSSGGESIVQVKHYLKTGFSGLLSTLKNKELFSELETQLEGFLSDEVEELKSDIDVSNYITSTEGYDGDYDINVDESGIVQCLEKGLNDSLLSFDSEIIEKLDLNIGSVIGDYVDVDDLLSDYFKSMEQEGYEYEKGGSSTLDTVSDIDDLFERT